MDMMEKDNILTFTLSNINVSMANALRRVILADIPTVVFRTAPYDKNDAEFIINTSRLNNEIIKQRLSCIPIHLKPLDSLINDYIMEIDVKNDTENLIYVTTADFKVKSKTTDKYLNDTTLQSIFPPDPISRQYIDLCRLRPKLSDSLLGEHLKLNCNFSIGTASENGSFNVVSTCTYANTPDSYQISQAKEEKLSELRTKYDDEDEIKYHITDWLNLDAKRITVPDSFDFKIESVGVLQNMKIVLNAINIIITRLNKIIDIYSNPNTLIADSDATIVNAFDITLESEDYTIGKILEYVLYETYYKDKKTLTFCGFRKPHPHINLSIIRLGFATTVDKGVVAQYIVEAARLSIIYFEKLLPHFGQIHPDELAAVQKTIPKAISIKSKSSASQPSASQPSASQPSVSQPSASQPSASQPSASRPSASQPSASRPSASRPSASRPSTSKRTTSKTSIKLPQEPLSDIDEPEASTSLVPVAIPDSTEEIEVEKVIG